MYTMKIWLINKTITQQRTHSWWGFQWTVILKPLLRNWMENVSGVIWCPNSWSCDEGWYLRDYIFVNDISIGFVSEKYLSKTSSNIDNLLKWIQNHLSNGSRFWILRRFYELLSFISVFRFYSYFKFALKCSKL